MPALDNKGPSKAVTFGVFLQQYSFSESPMPLPNRRVTRASSSTAAPPPSASFTSPSSTINAESTPPLTLQPPPSASFTSPSSTIKAESIPPLNLRPPSSAQMKKRKRESSSYAPPSKYAHLPNLLTDTLLPNLICVFIGVNPGLKTATLGHAYAHPSNLFWRLLYSSGCTPRLCKPFEDRDLPRLYSLGNTNIVARATKDASELSKGEMDEGVEVLEEKCRRWRPEAVCVVGKGIWESVWRVRHGRAIRKEEFRYGWQDDAERMGVIKPRHSQEGWEGARVFVATTTSGLAAGMQLHEKEEIWKSLGQWVERRRRERGILNEGGVKDEPDIRKEEEDEKAQCQYEIEGF